MSLESYKELRRRLSVIIPGDRLLTDPLSTLAYGTDASFYRLIPQLVVRLESEHEVVVLLRHAADLRLHVTFRAAGTSLSGQAVSDGVLAVLAPKAWAGISIAADASTITLQPAVVGARANIALAPHEKKIGPDPASINSAMIGGIAANNASGMCCGTAQNSYRTVEGMRIIFADGTVLDTRDAASRASFLRAKEAMVREIAALRDRILTNEELTARIRRKYRMKNTTGYSLNAFVDFHDPIDIIEHLMIGSEGTLGFIAEITYRTVPEHRHKASALLLFPDIATACKAVQLLKSQPADAVELMDRASLRSVEGKPGMPGYLASLGHGVSALLVETRAESALGLEHNIRAIIASVAGLPQMLPAVFTDDPVEAARLWNIRKGLFPSVGAMRRTGTTCIIEDVAFPIESLADATLELQALFAKHGYREAIIFGHALEGNLHFVFNQDFQHPDEVARYERFINDVTHMVVERYDGSLKAEHGTGRNMAPFVPLEWGAEAYAIMQETKRAMDPAGILNPGVILNDDPRAHLRSLKPLPPAHELVDKCIECGFCEVQCPSRDLTITPRQRIAVYREMARLETLGEDAERLGDLYDRFAYSGDETCATDGLCSLACPVGINTGLLVKELRHRRHGPVSRAIAGFLGRNMGAVTAVVRGVLTFAESGRRLLGEKGMGMVAGWMRKASGGVIPQWNRLLPRSADPVMSGEVQAVDGKPSVVYLPSCITRTMGTSPDYDVPDSVTTRMHRLLVKAGYHVVYPEGLPELCCGMAFDSKGFKEEGQRKAMELEDALLKASDGGRLPVVVDMSPCLLRMKETLSPKLHLYEPVDFILSFLVDRLVFQKLPESVVVHATCSTTRMGHADALVRLASMCAERVIVPEDVGCCGWAGDRGFTVPELNASALQDLRRSIPEGVTRGYSNSRTCEIGLSLHSGINYKSIVYLVDECTGAC